MIHQQFTYHGPSCSTPGVWSRTVSEHFDLIVVGAGIVGLGHALAGVERGLSVAVIDRSDVLRGASVRNFGHACVSAQSGRAAEYATLSRSRWLRLAEAAGFWASEAGTLVLGRADDEIRVLEEYAELHPDGELLSAAQARAVLPGTSIVGALRMPRDLQVDPREAVPALATHLAGLGVEFRWRTAAGLVEPGRVRTNRGELRAERIVVAVNHDLDELLPEPADARELRRCALDMLLLAQPFRDGAAVRLPCPILTGWSLLRYSAFASLPSTEAVRARLGEQHPDLLAMDLNLMTTQRPDGTLLVGDTHWRGIGVPPFQPEAAFRALKQLVVELLGLDGARVLERWQGVYASAADEFLVEEPLAGVHAVSVTTGIGMTCGVGLGETVVAGLFPDRESRADDAVQFAADEALESEAVA